MKKKKRNTSPAYLTWKKFLKNPLSWFSITIIGIALFIAISGYLVCPDKTPHANTQFLELSAKKPGFKVQMLKVRKNEIPKKQAIIKTMFSGKGSEFKRFTLTSYFYRNDSIIIQEYSGETEEEFLTTSFSLADVCFPVEKIQKSPDNHSYIITTKENKVNEISKDELIQKIEKENIITRKFLLGTDRFGRDMLSRMILGTRISLSVGFIAVLISIIIGVFMGAIAGYFPGIIDRFIMWIINVVWSVPTLLLVIALTMVLGKGFWQIFIAVGITMWVEVARIVRGQVMSIRESEFIMAGKALGFSNLRILYRHILPNVVSSVIVISAANFASAILIESGLSFLGIGIQPPVPSWGSMIRDHYGFIIVDKAFLAFVPGIAIMLVVLAFTLAGNSLRDALDVKGK